jgi:putative endonuclease
MAAHNQLGKQGEAMAAIYLMQNGYVILEKNWRQGNKEVDLIAIRNEILHFIEVKTRTSTLFGHPEDNVDARKVSHLIDAAEIYLEINPQWHRIQFDILAILIQENKPSYFLIEDVYL